MNNDKLFEKLNSLEEFAYKVPDKVLAIVSVIVNAKKKIKPKQLGKFGKHIIYGKSHNDLVAKSVELLDKIKYLLTEDVLKMLFEITEKYEIAAPEARKVIERLTKYNLNVLKQVGYHPQILILNKAEKLKNKELLTHFEDVIVIAENLLKPSFEGTTMEDYKTFTFHFGTLNVNDNLINIRKRTIKFLQKLYTVSQTAEQRKKVVEALEEATRRPDQSTYGDDVIEMIINDTNDVLAFYIDILDDADNIVIKSIEERINWFVKWNKEANLPRLAELEAKIASRTDYGLFRVFVGYDYQFSKDADWDKAKNERTEKINEFVKDISTSNLNEWREKILKVVGNYSVEKHGEFQYFYIFLFELGKKKPKIAFSLLEVAELAPFTIHIIAGIWKSSEKENLVSLLKQWISEGKNLSVIASIFGYVEEIDFDLLSALVQKAKKVKDYHALSNTIDSISRNFEKDQRLQSLLLEVITELSSKADNNIWLHYIWFKSENILKGFSEVELDKLLEALLPLKDIHYEAEAVLNYIAGKHPEKIIPFFQKRVEIKLKAEDKDDRYDAVPYDFKRLAETLAKAEKIIIPLIFKWFSLGSKKDNWLYYWEASNLISNIFPALNPTLQTEIINLIKTGDEQSLETLYSILGKYEGEEFLYEVVDEVVKKHKKSPNYKKIKSHLFGYLSQTGVVMGEYGLSEAYSKKKEIMEKYMQDKSKDFQNFAKEYITYLEKSIDFEKKRADEEIAIRQSSLQD